MNALDIVILVFVSVGFVAAAGFAVYRKIKRKGGCPGCDCCGECGTCCPHCKNSEK